MSADLGFDENGGFAEEREEKRSRNDGCGEEEKQKCEDRDGCKWYDPFAVDCESRKDSFHGGRKNEIFGFGRFDDLSIWYWRVVETVAGPRDRI